MSRRATLAIVSGLAVVSFFPKTLPAETGDSFSFVLIADPHVRWSHYAVNKRRLERCVQWVNAHRERRNIHLVFVLGDIGWESTGNKLNIQTAKEILDGLSTPYVPLVGDDDILFGRGGQDFAETFEPVYASLAALADDSTTGLANWRRGPVDVESPYAPGSFCYFQNFAFEYRGLQFVCADWCSRDGSKSIFKTQDDDSDLHDFEGGTWPWFKRTLAECPKDKYENIVLMSHNPMVTLRGGWFMRAVADGLTFSQAEFDQLSGFLNNPVQAYGNHVAAAYAAHVHFQGYLPQNADPDLVELPGWLTELMGPERVATAFPRLPGYDVRTIQAPHFPHPAFGPPTHPENEVRIELVTVTEDEACFLYAHESVLVPTVVRSPVVAGISVIPFH
ncbi:MAG: metallophosphoesterase [Phycisphaerae bacterium]|nr:metallophosphoesterase [Phycisphaerae bacterium]